MKLIIVRHGESVANVRGILAGRLDTSLSELGIQQAKLLASRLRDEKVDRIYSSNLIRARQTTAEIAGIIGADVFYDVRLRERCFGVFEGLNTDDFLADARQSGIAYHEYRPNGGESLIDLKARTDKFLTDLKLLDSEDKTYIISAHHSVNKMLMFSLLGYEWSGWMTIKQKNACVNVLKTGGDGSVKSEIINCCQHLDR